MADQAEVFRQDTNLSLGLDVKRLLHRPLCSGYCLNASYIQLNAADEVPLTSVYSFIAAPCTYLRKSTYADSKNVDLCNFIAGVCYNVESGRLKLPSTVSAMLHSDW